MTELGKTCSHGVAWGDECPECQLVWDRELVKRWGPVVDEARKRIEELTAVKTVEEVKA